jgi:hypothetical protein
MAYELDGWGWIPGRGKNVSLLHSVQTSSGAHAASYTMSTGGSFPGVKRLGHEADHSPPASAEVKNDGVIPPLRHVFMAHCLIN